MQFRDLSVEDLFKFAKENSKIYKKINEFQCYRFLREYPVMSDAEVILVNIEEQEDFDLIEKQAAFSIPKN